MSDFKTHDVVKHKTGNQEMIVINKRIPFLIEDPNPEMILCQWFDNNNKIHEKEFHKEDLILITSNTN